MMEEKLKHLEVILKSVEKIREELDDLKGWIDQQIHETRTRIEKVNNNNGESEEDLDLDNPADSDHDHPDPVNNNNIDNDVNDDDDEISIDDDEELLVIVNDEDELISDEDYFEPKDEEDQFEFESDQNQNEMIEIGSSQNNSDRNPTEIDTLQYTDYKPDPTAAAVVVMQNPKMSYHSNYSNPSIPRPRVLPKFIPRRKAGPGLLSTVLESNSYHQSLFIKTNSPKGDGFMLVVDGYGFYRNRVRKSKIHWVCSEMRRGGCRALASTTAPPPTSISQVPQIIRLSPHGQHLHPPKHTKYLA